MLKMSKYRVVPKVIISLVLLFGIIGNCQSQSIEDKLSKANSLFFEKDYTNAINAYNSLLPELTDSFDLSHIYSYTAICYENLGDSSNAYVNYKNAVNFKIREYSIYNKLFSLAKKQNDVDCQEFVLLQKMDVFPTDENSILEKLANLYIISKQNPKLFDMAERLIKMNPVNFKSYYYQAIAFQNNGENEKAESNYKKSLELKPDDLGANIGLGFLIFNRASAAFEKEQIRYEKLKKPSWDDYLSYLQTIKRIKAEYREAEPFLNKACDIDCNPQLQKALTIIKSRTGQMIRDERFKEVNESD